MAASSTHTLSGSLKCRKSTTWDKRLYFLSEGRRSEDFFFALKNPTTSAGFENANLGTKGQHATSRPPKPLKPAESHLISLEDGRLEEEIFATVWKAMKWIKMK